MGNGQWCPPGVARAATKLAKPPPIYCSRVCDWFGTTHHRCKQCKESPAKSPEVPDDGVLGDVACFWIVLLYQDRVLPVEGAERCRKSQHHEGEDQREKDQLPEHAENDLFRERGNYRDIDNGRMGLLLSTGRFGIRSRM